MKLSDKQLSMILGEHEAGQLIPAGTNSWSCGWPDHDKPMGCVLQVALNEPDGDKVDYEDPTAKWFDCNYYEDISAQELLAELEKNR